MKRLLSICVFGFLATGCGEHFQGEYFSDEAEMLEASCPDINTSSGEIYELELTLTISGSSMDMIIHHMQSVNGKNTPEAQEFLGTNFPATTSGKPGNFFDTPISKQGVEFAPSGTFEEQVDSETVEQTIPGKIRVQGQIEPNRDQMKGVEFILQKGDSCKFGLKVPQLVLQK